MSSPDEIDVATENVNSVVPEDAEIAAFYSACQWQGEPGGPTWEQQREVEQNVFLLRKHQRTLPSSPPPPLRLYRDRHVAYVLRSLEYLPRGYEGLSASRPWICFWLLRSLRALGAELPAELGARIVSHVRACWDEKEGAFGGGPGQAAHMASSYAAVAALVEVGGSAALSAVNVDALHAFMRRMRRPDGAFHVSTCGEADIRAIYAAAAVASLTGITALDTELFADTPTYVRSLQSFDGGFGGEPGNEAHGGNSYCAVATLVALGRLRDVDVPALLDWAAMRQMSFEGGFQGRTNKLVDACYSFWVGAIFPLLRFAHALHPYHPVREDDDPDATPEARVMGGLFDGEALQRYVLECAQERRGGFRDKPTLQPDLLHTCYALSGMSIAQQYGGAEMTDNIALVPTDPVYNVTVDKAVEARLYFDAQQKRPHD